MKTLVQLMVLTMIIVVPCKSKGQQWSWSSNFMKASATGFTDGEFKMAKDVADDIYISGGYLGPILLNGNKWISSKRKVLMVSKISPFGQIYWTDTVGVEAVGHDVCADGNGGCYSAFNFDENVKADSIQLIPDSYQNTSAALVHYNANGKAVWAVTSKLPYLTRTVSVASDNDHNAYLTGYFSDSVMFEGQKLISGGLTDIFVVKYNVNGQLQWAKSFGGSQYEIPEKMHVGSDGSIYLSGNFQNTMSIGGTQLNGNTAHSSTFLSKLSNNGNAIWSKAFVTIGSSVGASNHLNDIKENNGIVYTLGNFTDTLQVDSVNYILTSELYNKMFVMGFDENGHLAFEKHSSGNGNQLGNSMDFDIHGNILVAGTAQGFIALFDDKYLIVPYGKYMPYIIAYNALGEIKMLQTASFGNTGAGGCEKIITTSDGSCIALGQYVYDIKFGTNTTLTNYPTFHSNVYLAGLDVSTVSVEKAVKQNVDIKVFPNPITINNSILNIVSENPIDEISVYDVLGNVVHSEKHLDIMAAIDLSGKGAGIYFTEIKSGSTIVTKKIIIN